MPKGNVSPDIFALPCVTSAYKTMTQGIRYHVEHLIAKPTDWICKYENGEWLVLDDYAYQLTKSSQNLTKSSQNLTKSSQNEEASETE